MKKGTSGIVISVLFILGIVSCIVGIIMMNKDNKPNTNVDTNIEVESIILNKNRTNLAVNGGETLVATIDPSDATDKTITWTSSNVNIVSVENGNIKGLQEGEADITAKTSNGKTAVCKVIVKKEMQVVEAESITLNKTNVSLNVGASETLVATISPSNAINKTITWTSSNPKVVTVSNGMIKGLQEGEAEITVKTANGKTATCKVNVKKNQKEIEVASITLNKISETLDVGKTLQLSATISPSDATNKTVTWTSSNTGVATVSASGLVTAKAKGESEITAKSNNGKTAKCKVIVNEQNITAPTISVATENYQEYGKSKTATITIEDTDGLKGGTYKIKYGWGTSTLSCSNMTKTVQITVKEKDISGSTKVTITNETGAGRITVCNEKGISDVYGNTLSSGTVKWSIMKLDNKAPEVTFSPNGGTLNIGGTAKIIVNDLVGVKSAQYAILDSNSKVVKDSGIMASETYTMKFENAGTYYIGVKSEDKLGNGTNNWIKSNKFTINPSEVIVTGITLNKTSGTIDVGKTLQLSATISPSNATNKTVTWTSSNTSIATVSSSGLVTAKAKGEAEITAKSNNGKTAKCKITVNQGTVAVEGITLNKTSGTIDIGKTLQLSATINPSNATNKTVTWTSSNTSVAIVSSNGLVTAKAAGAVIITAKSSNGKEAKCTLDIYDYYDLVLLWGQSNMVGTMYNSDEKNTNLLKNIDADIVSHNVSYSRVIVDMPKNVAYEYLAVSNKLVDISTNPTNFGEVCYYVNGKLQSERDETSVQLHQSSGTNMISYFAKTYYEKTKHKVIIVLAASGGRGITSFLPSSNNNLYKAITKKYQMAESYILNLNNHNKIKNKFYVAYHGEADIQYGGYNTYETKYLTIHNALIRDLKVSFGAIVYVVDARLKNGVNDYDLKRLRSVQQRLVANNANIILGSDFPYQQLAKGNTSIFCQSNLVRNNQIIDNRVHVNSAGLSQIGREIANAIYNSNKIKK